MSRFKKRTEVPPGGWQFIEPKTGFSAPANTSFDRVVSALIAHRKGNRHVLAGRPTDPESVGMELEAYNVKRMEQNPDWHHFLLEGGDAVLNPPAPFPFPSQPVAVAGRANKTIAGIGVLKEWLGDGLRPVPVALAEGRAAVCAVCPKNQDPDWLQRLDGLAAEGVRKLIGIRQDLDLQTSFDDRLFTCSACSCYLKLKVFAPIQHIRKGLTQAIEAALDKTCWIPKEGVNNG